MILSDGSLSEALTHGTIVVDPHDQLQLQPASIDVRLGHEFLVPLEAYVDGVVDPYDLPDDLMEKVAVVGTFLLPPREFVLGVTAEAISVPHNMVARVEGRSSLGRLGLMIHATAGFVDPGWHSSPITLELANVGPWSIALHPGMRIGQLAFETLDRPCLRPYGTPGLGSRYQGSAGVTASRYTSDNEHKERG